MRISIPDDGLRSHCHYGVYLDGVRQHFVTMADEEAGILIRYAQKDGALIISPDGAQFATEELEGVVEIIPIYRNMSCVETIAEPEGSDTQHNQISERFFYD